MFGDREVDRPGSVVIGDGTAGIDAVVADEDVDDVDGVWR